MNAVKNHPNPASSTSAMGSSLSPDNWSGLSAVAWITTAILAIPLIQTLVIIIQSGPAAASTPVQYWIIAGAAFAAIFVCALMTTRVVRIPFRARPFILGITVQLFLLVVALLVDQVGLLLSGIGLLYAIMVVFLTRDRNLVNLSVYGATAGGILTALTQVARLFSQVSIPGFVMGGYTLLGISLMVYVVLLLADFSPITLRLKLISAILVMVIIPLTVSSYVQSNFTRNAIEKRNIESIRAAVTQTKNLVDDFITTNQTRIYQDAQLREFADYLQTPDSLRRDSLVERDLKLIARALTLSREVGVVQSYGLVDNHGFVVFDTDKNALKSYEKDNDYYMVPFLTGQSYVSASYSWDKTTPYIVFSAPVLNGQKNVIGVLRVRYRGDVLQDILETHVGLVGKGSYPVLLDENLIRLADTINKEWAYKPAAQISWEEVRKLTRARRIPTYFYPNTDAYLPNIESVIKSYPAQNIFYTDINITKKPIPHLGMIATTRNNWIVMYFQEQQSLNTLLENQSQIFLLVSLIFAVFIAATATMLGRVLTEPVNQLTLTAEKIAQGDLDAEARVETNDEIFTMGNAFNIMTSRLRSFISDLEVRVQERTQELANQNVALQFRARQLQTVSDVARNITSTQELEKLLTSVCELISDRFGFYHVGIFLIDEKNEYAVLQSANSEGGQRMLNRHHKLQVGQVGIVGYVTGFGKPRIATDVGEDAVYFNNPDLPNTRSEMALPLIANDRVIGALDVQSMESNAFTNEDIELFAILADQIAIAITNNRLYEETTEALAELSGLHRQYLRQEWAKDSSQRKVTGYRFTPQGKLVEVNDLALDQMEIIFESGQPSRLGDAWAVPIVLRGEPIGVIQVQDKNLSTEELSENELTAIKNVAAQIGQALENARLFEQTLRRAERERKVLEITSKIRSTNDYNQMIEIAQAELQKALNVSRAEVIIQNKPGNNSNGTGQNGNGSHNGKNGNHE